MLQSKTAAASKAKDKKAARKAAAQLALAAQLLIKTLKQDADVLAPFPIFKTFSRNGLTLQLQYFSAETLPAELMAWVFDLTQRNVKAYYESCPGWGWNDSKKRRELEDLDARYIIVTEIAEAPAQNETNDAPNTSCSEAAPEPVVDSQRPVAFVHLRYEMEEDEPVLYVYEIQVESSIQGRGVGKFLMQLVELIARRAGLARVMLTSFTANSGANKLYSKLGYVLDEGSPGAMDPTGDSAGYEILTKRLPPPKQTQA